MNCLIIMATYNGGKYINQQIESIINQTFDNWKMIIRDDGSSDDTVLQIQKFTEIDSRIHMIKNDTKKHGAYLNFWTLIKYTHSLKEYDYYFFADQDDIWHQDKLQVMIDCAEHSANKNRPLMLYSDMEVIDEEDRQIFPSINDVMGNGEMIGFSLFFTHGFIWGCSAMINKALFKVVPTYPLEDSRISIMSHDNYYGKFTLLLGSVKFVNKPLIKHRRHVANTTGGYKIQLSPISVMKKVVFQFDDLAKTHACVYNQTLLTVQQMEQAGVDREEIAIIKETINRGGLAGAYRLKKLGVSRKQFSRTLGIYLVMFLGSYRKYLIRE